MRLEDTPPHQYCRLLLCLLCFRWGTFSLISVPTPSFCLYRQESQRVGEAASEGKGWPHHVRGPGSSFTGWCGVVFPTHLPCLEVLMCSPDSLRVNASPAAFSCSGPSFRPALAEDRDSPSAALSQQPQLHAGAREKHTFSGAPGGLSQ